MSTAPLTVLAPYDVPGFLVARAIEARDLDPDATDRLHLVGLHTLNTLATLPGGALGVPSPRAAPPSCCVPVATLGDADVVAVGEIATRLAAPSVSAGR